MKRAAVLFFSFWGCLAVLPLASCQSKQPAAKAEAAAASASTADTTASASGTSSVKPASSGGPTVFSQMTSSEPLAGRIFGEGVSANNYYFAKRVSYHFPRPWEENASAEDRERYIWEALILHFESFRRGIAVTDEELDKRIDSILRSQEQTFTRKGDSTAYAKWVKEALGEEVELFENQMRYLYQVDKLKEQVRNGFVVAVSEEEMQQEFLNEQNHVGGEMVTFDAKRDAQAFYERVRDPQAWEAMKAKGEDKVRPVSLMTLEAYMDLWSIPKEQMYAFHALPPGSIGEPMPFGKQWCVYRLLDKRTGDLAEFPKQRDNYYKQITLKKQYDELKQWVEQLKASAKLEVYPLSQ